MSTLRDQLTTLAHRGLVNAVSHRLGLHALRRYLPIPAGLTAPQRRDFCPGGLAARLPGVAPVVLAGGHASGRRGRALHVATLCA